MNNERLNLQLCEINRLISYDRSKTIFEQQQKEVIVTNYDKDWDYKKVGNEYFAKRKNSNNWIKVTGKSLEAIKANVFKEKQQDYSQLQPISKSNSQIDGNLADQPRSDRTGSATRYNVAAKGIEQAGGLDQWLQNVQKSNDYRDQTTYKGNSKPKEPTIYSPKEGQYLDAQGNLKSPNAYWKLPYESNRFQWMTKNKKLPSPSKNNDYKEILLSIFKEDLNDWNSRPESEFQKQLLRQTLEPHFWLPVASTLITIFTGGVGGLILSGVLELADVALYLKQDRGTEAALGTIFLAIPAGQLLNRIPIIKQFSSKTLKIFMDKVYKKLPLNALEEKLLQSITSNKDELLRLSKQYVNTAQKLSDLIKVGGLGSITALLKLVKFSNTIGKWSVRIGAVVYTFDQLLLKLSDYYGNSLKQQPEYKNTIAQNNTILTEEQKNQDINLVVKESEPLLQKKATEESEFVITSANEETIEELNNELASINIEDFVIDEPQNTESK